MSRILLNFFVGFQGNAEAKGYANSQSARAAVIASNIFLSTSLIFLASQAAGCLDPTTGKPIGNCPTTIYGFKPQTLIPNIAVISGLVSAFFMPIVGAFVDFTPYRRPVGLGSAALITLIQAAQAYTVASTWFPMAILQALAAFLFQVQVLAAMAYLPGMAKTVGQAVMSNFSSKFFLIGFASQVLFLIIVVGVNLGLRWDDVTLAHFSQGLNVIWIGSTWLLAWMVYFPDVPARHALPEGTNVWSAGFVQIYRTVRNVNANFRKGLRWYFLALVFAEAASNAFATLSVTFLTLQLKMNGTQIGILTLITLICGVGGTKVAELITAKVGSPNTSWKLSMIFFSLVTIAGALVLKGPERIPVAYGFGALWGISIGWFFPTENLFFSMVLPPGQEAEMAGFFVYCSNILAWFPPLVFSLMVESGIDLKWGLMQLVLYLVIACVILCFVAPWDEVLEEARNEMSVVFGIQDFSVPFGHSSAALSVMKGLGEPHHRPKAKAAEEDKTDLSSGADPEQGKRGVVTSTHQVQSSTDDVDDAEQ